jgi:hypothetical protein
MLWRYCGLVRVPALELDPSVPSMIQKKMTKMKRSASMQCGPVEMPYLSGSGEATLLALLKEKQTWLSKQ